MPLTKVCFCIGVFLGYPLQDVVGFMIGKPQDAASLSFLMKYSFELCNRLFYGLSFYSVREGAE